ncbi:27973_t:CDS:2 [Dentiscutata erythropus]|uniref:27973_t:CDS:1 n=1 Tax=Dentiscutata erythropus TaxID=1348616 RepID=A0A9N9ACT8_9GLOM|nr:27973_t:CDS:2 [Dentiscutata erythropus]
MPLLGNTLDVLKYNNFPEYLKELQSKYGGFCEIHFGFKRFLIISNGDVAHPIHTSSVTLSRKFLYRDLKNPGLDEIGVGNNGIVFNKNLDEWKINREFVERIVRSRNFLTMITGKTYKVATDMFKLWDILINDQREIDLSKWLEKLSGDIAVTTTTGLPAYSVRTCLNSLGYDDNRDDLSISERELSSKVISLVNTFFKSTQFPPFIRHAPGISFFNSKFLKRIKDLEVFLIEIIQQRRTEIDLLSENALQSSDFLTLLLTVNTSHGIELRSHKSLNRSLNDYEVFGVIRDILLGSFETVSTTMCSVFYYICKYPSIKSKLLTEIYTIFGHSNFSNFRYKDLEKLSYCDALIKEALRLNPPFPQLPRTNNEPVEVGGYLWEKEQLFILHFQGINVNKNDWIDEEIFYPERFLRTEDNEQSINASKVNAREVFATFGGGARGKLWAIVEIKVLLVAVLMRYEIEFVNKDQELDLAFDSTYHWRELKIYSYSSPSDELATVSQTQIKYRNWTKSIKLCNELVSRLVRSKTSANSLSTNILFFITFIEDNYAGDNQFHWSLRTSVTLPSDNILGSLFILGSLENNWNLRIWAGAISFEHLISSLY